MIVSPETKLPGKRWLAAALIFAAIVMWSTPNTKECSVSADDDLSQTDYCFRLDMTVENPAGGALGSLTNYPVLFTVPAQSMISNGQMDARHWDVVPTQGGFNNEVNLLAQDCACDSSSWWLMISSLPDGESRTFRVYIGNDEQKRNQGISFTGNEVVQHADNATFDVSDNLQVDVEIEVTDSTAQTASLVDRWVTNSGYKLDLVDVASTLTLRAYANSSTCDATWQSAWTDTNVLFSYRFASDPGNDLFIDANGVNVAACDTDEASIAAATGDTFDIGSSLDDTIIREVAILNSGSVVARYGFDALSVSESTAVDPTYTGTISDYSPNALNLNYTFTRPQTGLTPTVGALSLTSESASAVYAPDLLDVMGITFATDPFASNTENVNALGYSFVDPILDVWSVPRVMGWTMFLGSIGLLLAVLVFWQMKNVPIAFFAAGLPLVYGSINGFIPMWWLILWVALFVTAYGAHQWGEQS